MTDNKPTKGDIVMCWFAYNVPMIGVSIMVAHPVAWCIAIAAMVIVTIGCVGACDTIEETK